MLTIKSDAKDKYLKIKTNKTAKTNKINIGIGCATKNTPITVETPFPPLKR